MARFSGMVRLVWAATALALVAAQEGRWVWGGSGRNAAGGYPPEVLESRPLPSYSGLRRPPAPVDENTDFVQPTYVPGNRPPPGLPPPGLPPPPPGAFGPGPGPVSRPPPGASASAAQGILTGPVPSWEQGREDPHAYKHYDRCKCAHSFNCPSPGIKFGHCDTGKQYCCFTTKGSSYHHQRPLGQDLGPGLGSGLIPGGPGPLGPRDPLLPPTGGRPVLVGPNGPTGVLIDPERPYGRPFIANGGPAGPGGPGSFARPRPTFVERPGPYDDLLDDYVRSNKNAEKN